MIRASTCRQPKERHASIRRKPLTTAYWLLAFLLSIGGEINPTFSIDSVRSAVEVSVVILNEVSFIL